MSIAFRPPHGGRAPHPPVPETVSEQLLQRIGKTRDGLLLVASGVYLLGYLVCAYYAWLHGLGSVPFLDAQYFAAGTVPALCVAGVAAATGRDQHLFGLWRAFLLPPSRLWLNLGPTAGMKDKRLRGALRRRRTFFYLLLGFAWLVVLRLMLFKLWPPGPAWLTLPFTSGCLYVTSLGTILALEILADGRGGAGQGGEVWVSSLTYWTLIGIVLLSTYVRFFYPLLPQALGGVQARRARIDLVRAEVSGATLTTFVSPGELRSGASVLQSVPIDVLFQGKDRLLIRRSGTAPNITVYELKNNAVNGIAWIDATPRDADPRLHATGSSVVSRPVQ